MGKTGLHFPYRLTDQVTSRTSSVSCDAQEQKSAQFPTTIRRQTKQISRKGEIKKVGLSTGCYLVLLVRDAIFWKMHTFLLLTVTLEAQKQYSKDAMNEIPRKHYRFKSELVKYDS